MKDEDIIRLKLDIDEIRKKRIIKPKRIQRTTNVKYGFNKGSLIYPNEVAVIDVGQNEYAVRENEEILVTYGIITCCGLIVQNGDRLVLMHIDSTIKPNEVVELLDRLEIGYNSQVTLVPGVICCFDYKTLKSDLENRDNKCSCHRLTGQFGSIAIEQENIKICSICDNKNIELKKSRHKL